MLDFGKIGELSSVLSQSSKQLLEKLDTLIALQQEIASTLTALREDNEIIVDAFLLDAALARGSNDKRE